MKKRALCLALATLASLALAALLLQLGS